MDAKKINLDTYPTLNNVCLVPKDTLKNLLIITKIMNI